jgi:hypothetical protein
MISRIQKITAILVAFAGCSLLYPFKTSALTPSSVLAQSSDQTSPVQSPDQDTQEDSLKPVAHFNPKAPVRLKLINQTNLNLEAGLSTGDTKHLPRGQDITLGPLPLSINCFVYPTKTSSNPSSHPIVLKYKVDVDNANNVVSVTITKYNRNDIESDSAISLRRFGSVFVY